LDSELKSLARRVQRLEDMEEIRALKNTYHLYVNDCRFDEIGGLFTEDAVVDMGYMHPDSEACRGRPAISEWYRTLTDSVGLSQLKQFTHNHTIELDGDEATGWAFLEARYGQAGTSYNVAAKYEETYRRVEERWRFGSMRLRLYFTVPMELGWATKERHHLVFRPGATLPETTDGTNGPV